MLAKAIAERFSAAAGTYAQAATMQARVVDRLATLLHGSPAPETILDVGCGTGVLTRRLTAIFPSARVTAVDIAPGMIEQAKQTRMDDGHVEWRVDDARKFHSPHLFQLIVSSSALHWMTPLDKTLAHLAELLVDGGQLVAALMIEGTLADLSKAREAVAPNKGRPVEWMSADRIVECLATGAFALAESARTTFSEPYASVEAMLHGLRAQGVTGAFAPDAKPLSRAEIKALTENYRRRWAHPDGSVTANYDVLFIRAEKKTR